MKLSYISPDWTAGPDRSLNWTCDVESWSYVENSPDEEVNRVDELSFREAKDAELANWVENGVFNEIDDLGQATVSTRSVFTEKTDGTKKACLVARGFQEDQSKLTLDSPTCSKESQRICLALISTYGFTVRSLDVKTAFLRAKSIDRDVFLKS